MVIKKKQRLLLALFLFVEISVFGGFPVLPSFAFGFLGIFILCSLSSNMFILARIIVYRYVDSIYKLGLRKGKKFMWKIPKNPLTFVKFYGIIYSL